MEESRSILPDSFREQDINPQKPFSDLQFQFNYAIAHPYVGLYAHRHAHLHANIPTKYFRSAICVNAQYVVWFSCCEVEPIEFTVILPISTSNRCIVECTDHRIYICKVTEMLYIRYTIPYV